MELSQTQLITVCINDLEKAKELLLGGANANIGHKQGYTLLHTAVESGFTKMVEMLISDDHVLIDAMTNFGMTALSLAIVAAQHLMVTLLLNAGANPNLRVAFHQSPIHLAVFHENCDIVRQLIRNGAKPNRRITKILLEAGADPNFKSKAKLCLLAEAILSVSIFKHVAVIKTLIDYGANVNEADEIENETPLHKAAAVGCASIVNYLVEKGADFKTKNVHGQTPYDIAKARTHTSICEALLALEDAEVERELNELESARASRQ